MMKTTIPELLKAQEGCIMVPCVYDCASARAVELAGYKAMLLSGGEVGEALGGLDEEEMSEDELLFAASHICAYSPLPLIIDCGCFTPGAMPVYRWARKFAAAGAGALLIEDEDGIGRETFLAMVKAAVAACEGTPCVVMARSNHLLESDEDFDYVACVLNEAMACGAYMSMACMLNSMQSAQRLARMVPGLKFYPDQNTHDGKPEVVNEEIARLGYRMVSFHYAMKVAMASMVEYGIRDLRAGNNLPSNELPLCNGYRGASAMPLFDFQKKYDLLAQFTGERRLFSVPGEPES